MCRPTQTHTKYRSLPRRDAGSPTFTAFRTNVVPLSARRSKRLWHLPEAPQWQPQKLATHTSFTYKFYVSNDDVQCKGARQTDERKFYIFSHSKPYFFYVRFTSMPSEGASVHFSLRYVAVPYMWIRFISVTLTTAAYGSLQTNSIGP